MPEHNTIQSYLETVASQIRWKRARPVVTLELERHLEDQRDAFAAEGHENAEQMALEEMGDPVKLGVELDSVHRPAPQYGLLTITILFALAGAILRIWLTANWVQYNMDIDPRKNAACVWDWVRGVVYGLFSGLFPAGDSWQESVCRCLSGRSCDADYFTA